MVPDAESGTEDFPRESLGRMLINYTPSALIAVGFFVYPSIVGYMWINATFTWMGKWTYLPLLTVCGSTILVITFIMFRKDIRSSSSSGSTGWIIIVCRIACVLWYMFLALLFLISIIMIFVDMRNSKFFGNTLFLIVICGGGYMLLSSYWWYWRCWYEKGIITQNEEMYGSTVFVSIPVFKLCGHFVLIVRDHKYELRLDARTRNRPVLNQRLLEPGEADDIRGTFGHHWFVVGWTRRETIAIQSVFAEAIDAFGTYNRIRNNCRHFLEMGCCHILDGASVWHEDMLLVGASLDVIVAKMGIMMWRSVQRELYRWVWKRWWGPDWETYALSSFRRSALLEDLMDHDIAFDEN